MSCVDSVKNKHYMFRLTTFKRKKSENGILSSATHTFYSIFLKIEFIIFTSVGHLWHRPFNKFSDFRNSAITELRHTGDRSSVIHFGRCADFQNCFCINCVMQNVHIVICRNSSDTYINRRHATNNTVTVNSRCTCIRYRVQTTVTD